MSGYGILEIISIGSWWCVAGGVVAGLVLFSCSGLGRGFWVLFICLFSFRVHLFWLVFSLLCLAVS
jgi:hypothetical protein